MPNFQARTARTARTAGAARSRLTGAWRQRWSFGLRLAGLSVLLGCAEPGPPGSSLPDALASVNTDGSLDGVWISDGYGWVLDVDGAAFRAYSHTPVYCARDLELEENFSSGADASAVEQGRIKAGSSFDPTRYLFERASQLPASCDARAVDTSPPGVLDAFVGALDTHYAFFSERRVPWDSLTTAARARVTTDMSDDELRSLLHEMIRAIGDPHVTLEGPDFLVGEGVSESDRLIKELAAARGIATDEAIVDWMRDHVRRSIRLEVFDGPSEARGFGRINFGKITDDVGYISFLSFGQLAEGEMEATVDEIDRALDDAITLWGDAEAVIVDVSGNEGGQDLMGRIVAARFAPEQTVGLFKYAGDADDSTLQPLTLPPSDRSRFTGDVYVLTTDLTVSAGESFVLYMRALPNVTHVGEPTRGALSDMLYKPLPNGWRVSVSNEVYVDDAGERWEARGISPDMPLAVFSDGNPYEGHSEAVHRIVTMIEQRRPNGSKP